MSQPSQSQQYRQFSDSNVRMGNGHNASHYDNSNNNNNNDSTNNSNPHEPKIYTVSLPQSLILICKSKSMTGRSPLVNSNWRINKIYLGCVFGCRCV